MDGVLQYESHRSDHGADYPKNEDAEEHFQSLDDSCVARSLLDDAALDAWGHEPFDDFVVKATFVEGDQSNGPDRNC